MTSIADALKAFAATVGRGGARARVGLKVTQGAAMKTINTWESLKHDDSHVKAGVIGSKSKKRPAPAKGVQAPTNVDLAIAHEFGTARIPARPFIGPSFEGGRKEYLALLRKIVKAKVYTGDLQFKQALGIVGAKMAADMKGYVTQGPEIPPPNAPAYLQRKIERGQWKIDKRRANARRTGKPVAEGPIPPPRTLVDTGRMVGSITWEVVEQSSRRRKRKGRKAKT